MKQLRMCVAMLSVIGTAPPLAAQPVDAVRNAARDEGVVRFALYACFVSDSAEQKMLNAQSSRFIRSLSAASGLPVVELESLAASGLANAQATKKLSSEQCKKGRDATVKLLSERDVVIGK